MAMQKSIPAENPDAYVAALRGWQQRYVAALRTAVLGAVPAQESIKWGHLVYHSNGPAFLIRAEETRVLFGFWRGQRLKQFDDRLRPGGKYEMASIAFVEGDRASPTRIGKLVKAAIQLNLQLGDPRDAAR